MKKGIWISLALAGVLGFIPTADAQSYTKKRCKSRQVYESPINNASVIIDGFCRPKNRKGYEWVNDVYGGFFKPLTIRPGQIYARGYAKGGKWIELGWFPERSGYIWVDGHYTNRSSFSPGYWERVRSGKEWVIGHWKNGRWQDGFWREIPPDGPCKRGDVLVDAIEYPNLKVPEFCRDKRRSGYLWVDDLYGGYWKPTRTRRGYVFVKGHIDGEFGNWKGEDWIRDRSDAFFVQGHYGPTGKWKKGKWVENKTGYTWVDGKWGSDGSWYPGQWKYDPAKACGLGKTLVEEIRIGSLYIPRFCRPSVRPGYSWADDPYGGYWKPTRTRRGYIFQQGHIESEFGNWKGEDWIRDRSDAFFVQGHYSGSNKWVNGSWKNNKPGYSWKEGRWNSNGTWTDGEFYFDPASACGRGEIYEEEIKLSSLFVPRHCRPSVRRGYRWVKDTYGGYWLPTSNRRGSIFVRGYIDGEFGNWKGESWARRRSGYVLEQGHYDNRGNWKKSSWKRVNAGYKWEPGRYNTDGSWLPGKLVKDPTYTLSCGRGEILVQAVKKSYLSIPAFCRPSGRRGYKWVNNDFGGWWKPNYLASNKIFIRGHWEEGKGWTGESIVSAKRGKFFVQGHYAQNGSWVEGKWLEKKTGYRFEEGHFNNDGSWIDGSWVKTGVIYNK